MPQMYVLYVCLFLKVNQEQSVYKPAFLIPVQFTVYVANLLQSLLEIPADNIHLVLRLVGIKMCTSL